MKHRLQITLEDAAVELLNKQDNKSQYIEDLILKQNGDRADNNLAREIKRLSILVEGLVAEEKEIEEKPLVLGRACCLGSCQHWVYDMDRGLSINTLTGETRNDWG